MAIGNPAPAKGQVQWLLTPRARLNFAALFKPKASRFNPAKVGYSCALVFEPGVDIMPLKQLVWRTAVEAWGETTARDPNVQFPFKTLKHDDKSVPGFPDGSVLINLQSQFAPQLCDQQRNPVMSPDVIYSGCYVHCMVNAFAWVQPGKRGVSMGLGNMQKLADGPRLDNRRSIEDDFQPLPGAGDGPIAGSGGAAASPMPF